MHQPDERSRFRPDIEGLRAVAVLAVVLFHAETPGMTGGFVGVDVFFIISGFLITGLLWREAEGTGTVRLRKFYGARARRLLPASAFVGVVTMIASVMLLPPLQIRSVLGDGIASALYVSNYWFVVRGIDYFAGHMPPSPFLHYWSLGVEEQFYLLWAPLILGTTWLTRLLRRRRAPRAVTSRRPYALVLTTIAVISFAMSFAATYIAPAAAFYSLPTRAWQLAAGGLLVLGAARWQRMPARFAAVTGWFGLCLILLSCIVFTPDTPFPGTAALLPTLGALLVIGAGCATPASGCGRLLGLAPMRAIGRISYSWYLWHWPALVLAPHLVGHPLGLPARLAAAAISAGLAWLTLGYLENPLRFATSIREFPWRSLALGAGATGVAVVVGLGLLRVAPIPVGDGVPAAPLAFRVPVVAAGSPSAAHDAAVQQAFAAVNSAVTESAGLQSVPSNLTPALSDVGAEKKALTSDGCLRTPFQSGQPECAAGDTASATTVALVGDSHAAMWNPAFRRLAEERHWRQELLAKGACPLIDLESDSPLQGLIERVEHCAQWRGEIIARLRAERPKLIVLSLWRGYGADESLTGFHAYSRDWNEGLTRTVRQLRATGAQVLVLGPIPDPHFVVPICLSGYLDDVPACVPARSSAVNPAGIAAESAATEAGGGRYTDLTELFCGGEHCPVIVGNTLVYLDENHLTAEYARALAPVMGALADAAVSRTPS